jgi:hypothetical protein
MKKTVLALYILSLCSSPTFAYDCWSWGEPFYCGEFPQEFRLIVEDVKTCMSENHLDLHLPELVMSKSRSFECDGEQAIGCTLFPDWIVMAGGWGAKNEFKILRHEIVHYILWVTGHPTENASHEDWQFFSEKCIDRTTPFERDMINKEEHAVKAKQKEEPSYPPLPETPSSPETSEKTPSQSMPAGEIYKWVDKNGTVHITNDINSIPQEYKDKLIK